MNEQESKAPGGFPKKGLAISIEGESKEALAATVVTSTANVIKLKLARPTSEPFQIGEEVRIKYWDEGMVVYYWDAEVIKIAAPGNQEVAISLYDKGVTIQRRRSYRFSLQIPFTFRVIDAADPELISEKVVNCQTENITAGGLLFETRLPLKVGDKLEINLQFTPSDQVNAVAWVVRSKPVKGDGESRHSVALEFLQLEEEEQSQLLMFLTQPPE